MRELRLPDLEKLDVIEVSAEQNIKICNWIDENISRISNVNNIFDKVIYKITNKENYYLLYFQFQKEELLCKVYKGYDSLKVLYITMILLQILLLRITYIFYRKSMNYVIYM